MKVFTAALGSGLFFQLLCPSSTHAQVRLYELPGEEPDLRLGAAVSASGDFDLDGVPDLVVGSHTWLTCHYGRVLLISGRTGGVLRTLSSSEPDDGFGQTVKVVGDLDLDGVPDLVVGAPHANAHAGSTGGGLVRAFSGRDGSLLWAARPLADPPSIAFGTGLAAVGDVNGDGIPDVAAGPCLEYMSPPYVTACVRVLSGRDGSVLLRLRSQAAWFGTSIAGPGDVNGDGTPDILVGAPYTSWNGVERGSAFLYSGADGSLMLILRGPSAYSHFGVVGAIGDVDHDGHPDLLVGAPGDDANGAGAGSVGVYSWATGTLLWDLHGNFGEAFGSFLSADGDVNGDGDADIAVGAPLAHVSTSVGGLVRVFSGRDRSLLAEITCENPFEGVGPCAILGDLNGDGLADLALGAPGAAGGGTNSGSVRVYLLGHAPPNPYCMWKWNSQNCASTPFTEGAPSLSVGDGFRVHVGGVLNHRPGYLLWGLARDDLPFGGGVLCVQPFERGRVQDSGGNPLPLIDCSGTLSFRFTASYLASRGVGAGTRVFCQFLSRDDGFAPPNNVGLSQGLAFTVLP